MLLFFDAIHALLVPLRLTQLSLMLECASSAVPWDAFTHIFDRALYCRFFGKTSLPGLSTVGVE